MEDYVCQRCGAPAEPGRTAELCAECEDIVTDLLDEFPSKEAEELGITWADIEQEYWSE